MQLKLTSAEAAVLVELLESAKAKTKAKAQLQLLLKKRIEDQQEKAPKGARETRWAASLVASLAEHEDTCGQCKKTFRRCAEDLDLHADLALGCG